VSVRRTLAVAGAAVAAVPLLAVLGPASPAAAHGTLSDPPSRIYTCWTEGAERPASDGCKAAVAAGGSGPIYDWNEVSLLDAGGQHQAKIPDGKLCGAGRDKFRGLDIATTGWKATRVSPGAREVTYRASAPHASSDFDFFITKPGFNPNSPLRWSDLEPIASFKKQNPSEYTKWSITLPQRTGRHILYSIWQRSVGSQEAFYTCSDVDFGGGSNPPPTTPPTQPPVTTPPTTRPPTQPPVTTPPTTRPTTPPPATTQPPAGGTWAPNTTYALGQRVTYNGVAYTVRQAHTSLTGWEPPNVPALWSPA
jgi:predicted carbohydrate-binding protein with CBM5 and CBM33 domain